MKVMSYYFSTELLRNVFVFLCNVTARICETLDLRKEFRMMGTTLRESSGNRFGVLIQLESNIPSDRRITLSADADSIYCRTDTGLRQ